MRPPSRVWNTAVVLSGLALLSYLARTFIDYGFVYHEFGVPESGALGWVTLFNLAFFGGWIWAVAAASHRRVPPMLVLLAYDALLLVFALVTLASLCPSPCRTAWPVGEIAIWSNLVLGIAASVAVVMSLRKGSSVPAD